MAAAGTLGQFAVKSSVPQLLKALEDPSDDVRNASYEALCLIEQAWGDPIYKSGKSDIL
jgi:HEAT repeat protein